MPYLGYPPGPLGPPFWPLLGVPPLDPEIDIIVYHFLDLKKRSKIDEKWLVTPLLDPPSRIIF